jgi:peptide/nickel transport system permease protein
MAICITILVAVPVGMVGGMWRGRFVDRLIRFLSMVGQSVPSFLVAVVLLQIFAVQLLMFPASSLSGGAASFVLPVTTLVIFEAPSIVRLIRTQVISEMQESYVTMAEIKGLPFFRVARHVLPNAAGPALAYAGADFVRVFLTGTVVVETIFAYPGIGYLTYQAVLIRDFPVVQGLILVIGLLYVVVSLLVDLIQGYLDPRVGVRGVAAATA